MRPSTRQLSLPCSRYIHPSRYHTRSTSLSQLLIKEYDHHISHLYHPVTRAKEAYDYLRTQYPVKWETSFSKKIGLLAQGVVTLMKDENEKIFIIPINQVPTRQKITHANLVCDYRPRKDDPYRLRLTIGGDNIPYPSDSGFPAATLFEAKIILNSVILTPGSLFICAYIKDYFL